MSDEIKKECDGNCAGCGQNSTCEEAKKEQENAVENEFKGLDYMIKLSYACVDRCEEMDYGKSVIFYFRYIPSVVCLTTRPSIL